ncbi:MAG: NAD(P)-binding protein [Asticcacaulis sp.]
MTCLNIIGGGLSGLSAALKAHDTGFETIRIHERTDHIGGIAHSRLIDGHEIRTGAVYFRDDPDPQVQLFKDHGLKFERFESHYGALSEPVKGRNYFQPDFGGPVLHIGTDGLTLSALSGPDLQARLEQYPASLAERLKAIARWHLGGDISLISSEAATPMGLNRIIPEGADLNTLIALKSAQPVYDELYGIARTDWSYNHNRHAQLPEGGFHTLFSSLENRLHALGVMIAYKSAFTPDRAAEAIEQGEQIYWSANPTPLFVHMQLPLPKLVRKDFHVHVFTAEYALNAPYYIHNQTAEGAVFRLYAYPTETGAMVTLECVQAASENELRSEVSRLCHLSMISDLRLGATVHSERQARWIFHAPETVDAIHHLREKLNQRYGNHFISGAWELYTRGEKYAHIAQILENSDRHPEDFLIGGNHLITNSNNAF